MGCPRQEYWRRLSFPSTGDLPNPGIEPMSLALQVDSLSLSHQESPIYMHLFSFSDSSFIGDYKTLSRVPCPVQPLPQPRKIYRTCLPGATLWPHFLPPPPHHIATLAFTCQAYSNPIALAHAVPSSWKVLSRRSSLSHLLQICAQKVSQPCLVLYPLTIPLGFRYIILIYLRIPTRPYEIQHDKPLL